MATKSGIILRRKRNQRPTRFSRRLGVLQMNKLISNFDLIGVGVERLRGNFTWPLASLLSSLERVNWGADDCESRSKGGPVFLWMVVVMVVVMVAHTV